MKKQIMVLVVMLLMFPLAAMAMQHDMSGMAMSGKMIMLQDVEVDGVMASAHMKDIKEKMAEHGMSQTHHFMVGFMNNEGAALSDGQVALKIESPNGSISEPIRLMGMSGAFGSDITLDQKGVYKFIIGTKLADGKTRSFNMEYHNM